MKSVVIGLLIFCAAAHGLSATVDGRSTYYDSWWRFFVEVEGQPAGPFGEPYAGDVEFSFVVGLVGSTDTLYTFSNGPDHTTGILADGDGAAIADAGVEYNYDGSLWVHMDTHDWPAVGSLRTYETPGLWWTLDVTSPTLGTGHDSGTVYFGPVVPTHVPVPGAALMTGIGLACMGWLRRR